MIVPQSSITIIQAYITASFSNPIPVKILHHITRQINQTTRGYDLRQIVKRTLPTDIFGLILGESSFI